MSSKPKSFAQRSSRASQVLLVAAMMSACSTPVEMQYKSNPQSNDFPAAAKLASSSFEYVEFSRMYIKVAPQESSSAAKAVDASTPSVRKGATASDPQASAAAPVATDTSSGARKQPDKKAKSASKGASGTAGSQHSPAAAASSVAPTSDSTSEAKSPPSLDPDAAMRTSLIDGKKWVATVVPVPDSDFGFWVRGVSGYWMSTSASIARYENSNVPSSVTFKSENLVAKRIGQFAGAAVSMVKLLGEVGVPVDSAGIEAQAPLLPFSIPVPEADKAIGDLNDGWSYSFEYDSSAPVAGAVDYKSFLAGVISSKVNYWPVPACRTATLTLFPPNNSTVGHNFSFNVVVSHPNVLRLQPIPVEGTLSLGLICGAGSSGSQKTDSTQTFVDELAAVQQGVQKVSDAKNGKAGADAASSAASGAAGGKAPKNGSSH